VQYNTNWRPIQRQLNTHAQFKSDQKMLPVVVTWMLLAKPCFIKGYSMFRLTLTLQLNINLQTTVKYDILFLVQIRQT
jgi:hypothetical protein